MRSWFIWLGGALLVGGAIAMLGKKSGVRIGAWTGQAAFADPHKVGRRAKELGLSTLDVMVGDQSAGATVAGGLPWKTYASPARITEVVRILRGYVPHVWVTVWAQPREDVIQGIAEVSRAAAAGGAEGVTLDAEEAWIQPLRRMGAVAEWSERIVAAAGAGGVEVATTTIVYHDRTILDPLLGLSDVVIPQAYATVKNAGARSPGDLERIAMDRFRGYGARVVMGAASWNQQGAYGLSVREATAASVRTAVGLGVDELRFWQLSTFDAEDIAGIKAGLARGGGVA